MLYSKSSAIPLGLIGLGLFYILFSFTSLNNENQDLGAIILMFGILSAASGVFLFFTNRKIKQKTDQDNLNKIFYQLIQSKKAGFTILDFAIEANIDAVLAREFIEKKANELSIIPEIDENGTLVYFFRNS